MDLVNQVHIVLNGVINITILVIPTSIVVFLVSLVVTLLEIALQGFVGSKCFSITTNDVVDKEHFERGNTLDKRIFLANIRREEVIDIDVIKHLSVDTVDTSDTLNNSCGIVRNIVVDNNARAV